MAGIMMMVPVLAVAAVIPVLIGIYVYRDASSRGMNAVLWTLVAVLAPSLIGFIIYLLVRGDYSNLRCPVCDARVREDYVVCPGCGTKLRPSCPSCSAPVEPGWKVCPRCAAPLPEYQDDIKTPVKKKDRTLAVVLGAVVLIPLAIILLAAVTFTMGSSMATGSVMMPVDEYVQETGNTQIEELIREKNPDLDEAVVLMYETESGDETETQYLIYTPLLSEDSDYSVNSGDGLFRDSVSIDIEEESGGGNLLLYISCTSDKTVDLELTCEGNDISYEIEKVDDPLY